MTADEQIAIPILLEQEFKRLLRAYLAKIRLELEAKKLTDNEVVDVASGEPIPFVDWSDIEEVFAQYEHD